jgi:hypothetical protein
MGGHSNARWGCGAPLTHRLFDNGEDGPLIVAREKGSGLATIKGAHSLLRILGMFFVNVT